MGHRGLVGLFVNKFIRCQGSRVRIPSPTFPFERCIVWGEEDEEERRRRRRRTRTFKTRKMGETAKALESGTAKRKAFGLN